MPSTSPPFADSEITIAASEETPLLSVQPQGDVYDRFSFRKKQSILLIVSFAGILTCGVFLSFEFGVVILMMVVSLCRRSVRAYYCGRCRGPWSESGRCKVSRDLVRFSLIDGIFFAVGLSLHIYL